MNNLKNNAFFVLNEYSNLISLNQPKQNLSEYTDAKYREGRDKSNKLTYHSPQDVINIIGNCEIIDLKDNQKKKLVNVCSQMATNNFKNFYFMILFVR